ncbi:MAG: hydrogenase expression/formation protein HypE [Verrucomicrobia bacterium]|nr:hydrogenase expression/formation protein HypE [Verrucomicrobiota bacterium]
MSRHEMSRHKITGDGTIQLGHGSGGVLTRELIRDVFLARFDNPALAPLMDSALVKIGGSEVAFTTDAYVVKPLEFPGGDIGTLAVCGTINDLAVMGAQPVALSCAVIMQEGLEIELVERITQSMQRAAAGAGVPIVTGDTKVVERASCDGLFITTAGLGVFDGPDRPRGTLRDGDAVIVSGALGDHGTAVLVAREGLKIASSVESDCAALNGLVEALRPFFSGIRIMRDPTRGGLATTLNEFVEGAAGVGIVLREGDVPLSDGVAAICELLGLDPLYIANEGKLVLVCDAAVAGKVVAAMRAHPLGARACAVGTVTPTYPGRVCLETTVGGLRVVDMLVADQLPRIC